MPGLTTGHAPLTFLAELIIHVIRDRIQHFFANRPNPVHPPWQVGGLYSEYSPQAVELSTNVSISEIILN